MDRSKGDKPQKKSVDKGECEHGKRPWWDCEKCRDTSHYGFSGDFK